MGQQLLSRLALTCIICLTLGVSLLSVVLLWPAWRQHNIEAALQRDDLVTQFGYHYAPAPPRWWPASWSEESWDRRGYVPFDIMPDFDDPEGKVVRTWIRADEIRHRW